MKPIILAKTNLFSLIQIQGSAAWNDRHVKAGRARGGKYGRLGPIALALFLGASVALAQGTSFTYQGQLQNSGVPASGTYNFTFTLYTTNTGGNAVAGPVTNSAVAVTNGLFTVSIDFGAAVWNGATNWLQIGVESNGAASFVTLTPRQELTPAPYAIYAEEAGTVWANQLTSLGNTNGSGNFFVGPAGNSTTSGSFNTAAGEGALSANTSGGNNTADGQGALYFNTSGSANTAAGAGALFLNTIGDENTADGYSALYFNTSGSYNTASGESALFLNASGSYNTADGQGALFNNAGGSYNTAAGFSALLLNTSGSNNIALGYNAGTTITTGSSNIDIGNPGVSGDANIIRIGSGQSRTYLAGVINGNGGGLTGLASSQLTSIGNTNGGFLNFFVGPAGNSTTSGIGNTADGVAALTADTSGSYNTADGLAALNANTSGFFNTADGLDALYSNTSGSYNTADGIDALYANTAAPTIRPRAHSRCRTRAAPTILRWAILPAPPSRPAAPTLKSATRVFPATPTSSVSAAARAAPTSRASSTATAAG